MRRLFCVLLIAGMALSLSACSRDNSDSSVITSSSKSSENSSESDDIISSDSTNTTKSKKESFTIYITIGDKKFTAVLYDNPTTHALIERLPLTLEMQELNGNEKYYQFSDNFPTGIESVGTIKAGDLMLYQDDYLVLFYESHTTSYSYTKIGYIEETSGLAKAVGNGNITVSFSVQSNFVP